MPSCMIAVAERGKEILVVALVVALEVVLIAIAKHHFFTPLGMYTWYDSVASCRASRIRSFYVHSYDGGIFCSRLGCTVVWLYCSE